MNKDGIAAKLGFILGCAIIIFQIVFAIFGFQEVDSIYAHRNFQGQVDRVGARWELFLFPGISVMLFVFLQYVVFSKNKNTERVNLFFSLASIFILLAITVSMFDSIPAYHFGDVPFLIPGIFLLSAVFLMLLRKSRSSFL